MHALGFALLLAAPAGASPALDAYLGTPAPGGAEAWLSCAALDGPWRRICLVGALAGPAGRRYLERLSETP